MNEPAEIIHSAHRDKNRHWHFLMLLIPSIVFALVLAFFLRNKQPASTNLKVESQPIVQTPPISHTVSVNGVTLSVRLAKTSQEQIKGLSGVTVLGENEGMLFEFPGKTRTAFWMKDMLIPLDIIWIADGKIIQIDKDVPFPDPGTPDSQLKLIVPNSEVDMVLEVNAGWSEKNNIKVGDSLISQN